MKRFCPAHSGASVPPGRARVGDECGGSGLPDECDQHVSAWQRNLFASPGLGSRRFDWPGSEFQQWVAFFLHSGKNAEQLTENTAVDSPLRQQPVFCREKIECHPYVRLGADIDRGRRRLGLSRRHMFRTLWTERG